MAKADWKGRESFLVPSQDEPLFWARPNTTTGKPFLQRERRRSTPLPHAKGQK